MPFSTTDLASTMSAPGLTMTLRSLMVRAVWVMRVGTTLAIATPALALAEVETPTLRELWVADLPGSGAERTLLATLQGLVNTARCRLWIRQPGMYADVLAELSPGAELHELHSAWEALAAFRTEVHGVVAFDARTDSINVATSLCGPLRGVAVEQALLARTAALDLPVLADARGLDQRRAWDEYHARCTRGVLIEQDPAKEWHLRDFAVARSAFVYWKLPADEVAALVRAAGPGTTVYGWGAAENEAVKAVSRAGGDYVASDWSCDLSALQHLHPPLPQRPRPPHPAPARSGERIVAFVMSDGDNLCFVGGGFIDDTAYFGNPHRGEFSMTWELPPRMAELYAPGLALLYRRAARGPGYDDFVMGSSGAGYCFPNHLPDRAAYAAATAAWVPRTGLDLVTLLNDGGDLEQARPMLDQPAIAGVLYKDWAPYNAHQGRILWHHGKPCVSYRYLLWEGLDGQDPAGVAKAIAAQPAEPATDAGSYALINVHAWSWKTLGGPLEAVRRTIALLPPRTRVVTAGELFTLLHEHLGDQHHAGEPGP